MESWRKRVGERGPSWMEPGEVEGPEPLDLELSPELFSGVGERSGASGPGGHTETRIGKSVPAREERRLRALRLETWTCSP